jgi:transposase-like protein
MALYNQRDVTVLKQVMMAVDPWHNKVNFSMFELENKCSCGSKEFNQAGMKTTNAGKFERFICASCGKEYQKKANLIHPDTRKELLK